MCVIVLQGETSAICAAFNGHADVLKVLIDAGANIDPKNNYVSAVSVSCV